MDLTSTVLDESLWVCYLGWGALKILILPESDRLIPFGIRIFAYAGR